MVIDKENKDLKKNLKAGNAIVPKGPSEVLQEPEAIAEKDVKNEELTQRIYVGPNMPALPKYTVVEDGFTPHIKGIIEECPAVEKMFVKIPNMSRMESRVAEAGTRPHRDYNLIVKYMTGKGE